MANNGGRAEWHGQAGPGDGTSTGTRAQAQDAPESGDYAQVQEVEVGGNDMPKSKGKVSKVIAIFKKPGQPDKVEVKNGKAEAQPAQPTPAELRAQAKAMKPMGKQAFRITPKMPPLR